MIDRPAVLITGAARRLGRVVAQGFGAAGWHVVIHYGASEEAAATLAASLPSAETIGCDLSDPETAGMLALMLSQRLRDWRVLVNCAAVFRNDDARELDPAIAAEAMAVNALSPARLAQGFLAYARASGGRRVIQFLDQKIANPNPDFFSYTMSKHALAATVPMLAMGAARSDDRVYGLAPGAMMASHDQTMDEHEVSGRLNLLERLTDPAELARGALFLSEGWLANGQTLFVDSGQHLLRQPRDVLYLARGME